MLEIQVVELLDMGAKNQTRSPGRTASALSHGVIPKPFLVKKGKISRCLYSLLALWFTTEKYGSCALV